MIARKSALMFLMNAIYGVLSYVGIFFISHYLGPEPLGMIGFAVGFIGMFLFISNAGFELAHIKRISEGKDLKKCIGVFAAVKVALTAIFILVVSAAILISKNLLNKGFSSSQEIVILIILLSFSIKSISEIGLMTFAARKEIAKQQIPLVSGMFIQTVFIVAAALFSLGIIAVAGAYVLGAIVVLITAISLFRDYKIGKPTKEYLKSYSAFAIPLVIASSFSTISVNIDKVMIRFFMRIADVGFYYGTQNIVGALQIISYPVMMLLIPTISEYHSKKEFKSIKAIIYMAERYLSMVMFPVCIFVFVFATPIIKIFLGTAFLPAVNVLRAFSILAIVGAMTRPYSAALVGINLPKTVAAITIGGSIFNIILNFFFIPKEIFGITVLGLAATGAAIATIVTWTTTSVFQRIVLYKKAGVGFNWTILKQVAVAAIVAVIAYNLFPATANVIGLIIYGIIIYAAYLLGLFLIKEFTKKDIKFFMNIAHPGRMKSYITSEIRGN